jgi:hypothetical protein
VLAHASAFVLDGALFVAGGVDGRRPLTDIYSIDPSTGASALPARCPAPVRTQRPSSSLTRPG